jgi:hypothetical protein
MRYSEHFAVVAKHSGMPRLNYKQLSRMMNIISLEGQIRAMENMRAKCVSDHQLEAGRMIQLKQHQLSQLTDNKKPDLLLRELILLSDDAGEFNVRRSWQEE